MSAEPLSVEEKHTLLQLARRSIEKAVCGEEDELPDLDCLSAALKEPGVCFVTLTMLPGGELRGCIGGLEAVQSLAIDVCRHAVSAALEDYRFPAVSPEELPNISIEISRLTPPEPLEYDNPADLPGLLHPHVDGVVLHDGYRRATFLPQVWEKISDPGVFLSHLCQKMGSPGDAWRRKKLKVEIYHVEEFHE